jgi:hypothetical protein
MDRRTPALNCEHCFIGRATSSLWASWSNSCLLIDPSLMTKSAVSLSCLMGLIGAFLGLYPCIRSCPSTLAYVRLLCLDAFACVASLSSRQQKSELKKYFKTKKKMRRMSLIEKIYACVPWVCQQEANRHCPPPQL